MLFSHTVLLIVDPSTGAAYFGWLQVRKRNLSMEQARNSLRQIPNDEIYPPMPADWSALEMPVSEPEHYVKRPRLASYRWAKGTSQLADRFLKEGRTLHLMRQDPHPNVAKLEGCLVGGGRILGLVLTRYPTTLQHRVQIQDGNPLDRVSCFRGIVAGVRHFHSLGIAHNDVNPNNIMLDEGDRPVIVDFGGCMPFGEKLTESGTPGWNEGFDEDVSRANNDRIGLTKVGEWLGVAVEQLSEELLTLSCAV
jgi:serine/threonine protein kinase